MQTNALTHPKVDAYMQFIFGVTMFLSLFACVVTHHPVDQVALPTEASAFDRLIDEPGPLTVETVNSADWVVPRSGILDLKDPKAVAAGLTDRDEPIKVFFHVLNHPTLGTSIIDTGVETALRDHPEDSSIPGMLAGAIHLEELKIHAPLGAWLGGRSLHGVYLTHMHLDHILGMSDVPVGTPVWSGPGEASAKGFMNLLQRGVTDTELANVGTIHEFTPVPDPSGRFAGLVDVLGDGSLWGLWTPGHTPGSMAYVARTPDGPVLYTGDTSHTRWGWDNGVAPGSYTEDAAGNTQSLAALKALVAAHPDMVVHLGHQD